MLRLPIDDALSMGLTVILGFPFIFFATFNLGVAMVAMVAMPREYTENDSRQTKLPDAWCVRIRDGYDLMDRINLLGG